MSSGICCNKATFITREKGVISDIDIEEIDSGYRLLQQIKQFNPSQPFIFLSTQMNLLTNRVRALELGADGCFGKPFELEELLMVIDRFLLDNANLNLE